MLIPEALRTQILNDLGPVLEGPGWAAALQGFLGGNGNFPYPAPALRAQVLEEIAHGPAQLAAQMMRDVMSTDWSPQLSSSAAAPLLYVPGIMPSDLGRLREVRPDAFVGAVAGGGHYMSLEVPDQINATIDRFITLAFATENSPNAAGRSRELVGGSTFNDMRAAAERRAGPLRPGAAPVMGVSSGAAGQPPPGSPR